MRVLREPTTRLNGFSTDTWDGPKRIKTRTSSVADRRGSARQHLRHGCCVTSRLWTNQMARCDLHGICAVDTVSTVYCSTACSKVFYHLITVKPRGWNHDQNLIGGFESEAQKQQQMFRRVLVCWCSTERIRTD